jgi:hypothetical protein
MAFGTLSAIRGALARRVSLCVGTLAAFIAVDLLLVVACLLALRQNVRLGREVAADEGLLTPAKGTMMPPLAGEDVTGTPRTIAYGQERHPTLVYTFSKECGHCQENWRAMRSLQVLAPRRLRTAYVDTFGDVFTPDYLAASGIGQSVLLVQFSPEAAIAYDA